MLDDVKINITGYGYKTYHDKNCIFLRSDYLS